LNVLVTGTSSGIGRATALHLAANGVQVFAACRRDSDGAELRQAGGERIVPVLLDVTHDDQIERAVKHIDQATAGAGLDGLVNNAGIGQSGPVELTSPESLKRIFDINLFGQLADIALAGEHAHLVALCTQHAGPTRAHPRAIAGDHRLAGGK